MNACTWTSCTFFSRVEEVIQGPPQLRVWCDAPMLHQYRRRSCYRSVQVTPRSLQSFAPSPWHLAMALAQLASSQERVLMADVTLLCDGVNILIWLNTPASEVISECRLGARDKTCLCQMRQRHWLAGPEEACKTCSVNFLRHARRRVLPCSLCICCFFPEVPARTLF